MNVLLISTYEFGRQPFSIASPAAWLKREGCTVGCLDLAVQRLEEGREALAGADLIAFSLPMHTATRLAVRLLPRIKRVNPSAHLCCYGLYAPLNAGYLRELGVQSILGGEFEEGLQMLVRRLADGAATEEPGREHAQPIPLISLGRQSFHVPDRTGLPALEEYAHLQMTPEEVRTVGYTEASRGCRHLCRHCPIVPVYDGNFRVVQREVVLEDIRRQVADGAQHITFGDPDFFNGPTHAVRIVKAVHAEFPELTYDVTIKVEHLLQQQTHLPTLRDTGCLFVTCAVESVCNRTLQIYDKHHTREDFIALVHLMRAVGLQMNPTFVSFSPWVTLEGYLDFLGQILELDLVDYVSPIQYGIRLLIPEGSKLLELLEVRQLVGEFDRQRLVYPWVHADAQVDQLSDRVLKEIEAGQSRREIPRQIFQRIWTVASRQFGGTAQQRLLDGARPLDQAPNPATVPYLTEPWYC